VTPAWSARPAGPDQRGTGHILQDGSVTTASALDPDTEHRIRDSISRQTLLTTLGVTVAELASGRVVLDLPYRARRGGHRAGGLGLRLRGCLTDAGLQATMMAVGPGPA